MYAALYNYVTCYTHVETRLRKPTTLLAGSKRIPARSSNARSQGSDLSGSVRNQPSCMRRRHCGKFQSYSSLPRINAPNAATLASNCTSKTMHRSSAQPLRRVLAPARAPPGSRRSLRLPARGVQTKTAAVLGQERERSPPRRREGPAASENGLKVLVFLAEQSQPRHRPPWTTEAVR